MSRHDHYFNEKIVKLVISGPEFLNLSTVDFQQLSSSKNFWPGSSTFGAKQQES